METFQKTVLDEWDHPTINRPDSSNVISDWTHDTDPNGVVPTGWVLPGQYKVVCFLGSDGNDILSLMVGVKYKNCTGRYSTTRDYITVLQDYLKTVDYTEILKAKVAWRERKLQAFAEANPEWKEFLCPPT